MKKILFDSHAHINEESYSEAERAVLIQSIENSEVAYVVDVGYDIRSSALAAKHAETYKWCYAAVGIHPLHVQRQDRKGTGDSVLCHSREGGNLCEILVSELEELTASSGVKAIGEIGLDYRDADADKALQQEMFRAQIRFAKKLELPISIHEVAAKDDVIRILKEEKAFDGAGVLLHCFSGSKEQALECVRLGAMISIGGPVTWVGNRKATEPATAVPLDHLLIETDAPFLTPEPFCKEKNSPVLLEYIARKVAELRGMSYEELAEATLANGIRFYGI